MEVSSEIKKEIIKQKIQLIENTIYSTSVEIRVSKKIKDSDLEKKQIEEMKKLEIIKDCYEEELKNLYNDQVKQ